MTLPEALVADLDRDVGLLESRFGHDLVSVVLFGSCARGEAQPESDIDLLVIIRGLPGNRRLRYEGFYELAREVSPDFSGDVSVILATPEEAIRVKPYYV